MREIQIYCLHPYCYDVNSTLEYMQLSFLLNKYKFIWNEDNPTFLIATEHIYSSPKYRKIFNKLYRKAEITIFFSREAVSPDFNLFDYACSFDYGLTNEDRFIRLPGPIELNPDFVKVTRNDIGTTAQAKSELEKKKGFCNFLYSNPMAHPNRDKLFYLISKYKQVDSLGRHLNNVGNKALGYIGHELDSISLKSNYKFSISAENAAFAGYTSEKIVTSLIAHTVPIYFGDPCITDNFNPKCFINCADYKRLEDVVAAVREIDNDDEKWCEMVSAPWQTEEQLRKAEQRQADFRRRFIALFESEVDTIKRRPQGTFVDGYVNQFVKHSVLRTNLLMRIKNRIKCWL